MPQEDYSFQMIDFLSSLNARRSKRENYLMLNVLSLWKFLDGEGGGGRFLDNRLQRWEQIAELGVRMQRKNPRSWVR